MFKIILLFILLFNYYMIVFKQNNKNSRKIPLFNYFERPERLDPYLKLSDNDKNKALELYILYTKINESLYIPLQNVEVAVRNSFYESIALKYGYNWIMIKHI